VGKPTARIYDIEDARPHAVIDCTSISKIVYVIPVSLILDWAEGRRKPSKDIRQRIIAEWFATVCGT
jgi:hypothetical protein